MLLPVSTMSTTSSPEIFPVLISVVVPGTPHRQQRQADNQATKQAERDDFVGVPSRAARAVKNDRRNSVAHRLLPPQADHHSARANCQYDHHQCLCR